MRISQMVIHYKLLVHINLLVNINPLHINLLHINLLHYQSTPYQSTPHQSTPHQSTPYQSTPYQSTQYQSNPYQSTPYQSTPYQSTPYQSTQYQSTPYQSTPYQSGGRDGRGRTAVGIDIYEDKTLDQLREIAAYKGYDVPTGLRKGDMIDWLILEDTLVATKIENRIKGIRNPIKDPIMNRIEQLPVKVKEQVFMAMDVNGIVKYCLNSRDFSICKDFNFWMEKLDKDFGSIDAYGTIYKPSLAFTDNTKDGIEIYRDFVKQRKIKELDDERKREFNLKHTLISRMKQQEIDEFHAERERWGNKRWGS